MKNDQALFAKTLEDIRYTALSQGGFIKKEEVYEAFAEMELTQEQFDMVFEYLSEHKIGVDEPLDDGYLSREDRNILDEYKEELKNLNLLTDGEVKAYTMAAMNDDKDAQAKLITHYLPKVIEISKLYTTQGVLLEDLIGEGNLAIAEGVTLLGALENPDEADGMLIKLIMDAMEGLIKENYEESSKDEKLADKVNLVFDEAKKLAEEVGRNVTVDELCENTSLSKKAINEAIKLSAKKIEYIEYTE